MSMSAEVLVSTSGMPKTDWLEMRRKGLGGSDAAVVLGLSKWKTAFELWHEKTGLVVPEETDNEAAEIGTEQEEYVAWKFTQKTGKKVQRRNAILKHPEYPWMLANVDRMVVGEDAILECKTASEWLRSEWEGEEVPDAYLVQVQHYLAVTGRSKGYIAVLIGGNKFRWKEIQRDEELIRMIIEGERKFWEFHVLGNQPPMLDGSSAAERYLKERYDRGAPGKAVNLSVPYLNRIDELLQLKQQAGILDKRIKEIENQIKNEMQDAEHAYIGRYEVQWKTILSNRLDTKAFQTDYPELFGQYAKTTPSRRFEIKEVR